jgi:hypothetical protein
MLFTGPSGRTFNFADASDAPGEAAQMLWLGRKFNRPEYLAHERSHVTRPSIFHVLWYDQRGNWPAEQVGVFERWIEAGKPA